MEIKLKLEDKFDLELLDIALNTIQHQCMVNLPNNAYDEWITETNEEFARVQKIKEQVRELIKK